MCLQIDNLCKHDEIVSKIIIQHSEYDLIGQVPHVSGDKAMKIYPISMIKNDHAY